MRYLFGQSYREGFGLSMGVDLLPFKACNLDCVYCELGGTANLTCARGRFVPPDAVLREIRSRADESFDHLTFAGSGEPTLNSDLGEIVRKSREIVDVPVAVITNSTLLTSKTVRSEVASADVVLPSLDAATQTTFGKINRPAEGLMIDEIVSGLRSFRSEFGGEIWLEVMLVKGINEAEASEIAAAVESIDPDRIQLNTVVRPPTEPVLPLNELEMNEVLQAFPGAELIPDWDWSVPERSKEEILDLLSLRPCTVEEICESMGLKAEDAIKYASILERDGEIRRQLLSGKHCFCVAPR
jgi:wyosine [tRNA(Phe)-imidazoG37] synthetase (radical SAM superfamily)